MFIQQYSLYAKLVLFFNIFRGCFFILLKTKIDYLYFRVTNLKENIFLYILDFLLNLSKIYYHLSILYNIILHGLIIYIRQSTQFYTRHMNIKSLNKKHFIYNILSHCRIMFSRYSSNR